MLSTKNIKSESENLGPIINPGIHKVKINDLTFEKTGYKVDGNDAYNITMHVETEPIGGDFQGFFIDSENKTGPRYEGQIGRVKFSRYGYVDKVLPSGVQINRDESVLKSMVLLAETLDIRHEVDEIQADTIFEFMKACREIFKNSKYFNACIGGREWMSNKTGYTNMGLHLVKYQRGKLSIEKCDAENSRLIEFDPDVHIERIEKKTVSKFEDTDNPFSDDDFEL
jgi:hypothetical protein